MALTRCRLSGRSEREGARAMKLAVRMVACLGLLVGLLTAAPPAGAAGNPMRLVGALNPWKNGQFSNVAADAGRHVGYLGSYDDQGVAVIDTTDPTHPVLTDRLSDRKSTRLNSSHVEIS